MTANTEKCSNNTNKLSPQEPSHMSTKQLFVQIIQINLVLKNWRELGRRRPWFK